jgi:hypothetical protein
MLRSRSEIEKVEIVQRIGAGEDAESVAKKIKDGDLLLQLALVPEARYRYEFPHMKEMPQFLQRPDNTYLQSTIYQWTISNTLPGTHQALPSSTSHNSTEVASRYTKPFHAAQLIEPLLDGVKPSRWTNVPAGDELMLDLLRMYFLREHMWFTYLNIDFFLTDMASGSEKFCSSLSVNCVLAFACVSLKSTFMTPLICTFSVAIQELREETNTAIRSV